MKIFAPSYYTEFNCIADKCRHSCCIGWEIDIDGETVNKYKVITDSYGTAITESIAYTETPHFILTDRDRCPHLDSKGLCRIITELGDDYLCSICKEHPRFYNETARGVEVGIGISCEEACRIVLSSDGYDRFVCVGEDGRVGESCDFDPLVHRSEIFAILKTDIPHEEKLKRISSRFGASLNEVPDGTWREIIGNLEYLNEAHKELFLCFCSDIETPKWLEKSLERVLAYFVFRHCSSAHNECDFKAAVGFSLLCERLLCSIMMAAPEQDILDLARIISEELEYSEDNTEQLKLEFMF